MYMYIYIYIYIYTYYTSDTATATPSQPIKSFPIKSPLGKLSIKSNGHENSHP